MTSSSDHNGPSTEKVVHAESGGDGSTSKIAVGITVPIILIVVIAVVSYRCYRKKYPVRMILGRDFGKFTNPEYRPPSTGMHSLVRQDADQFFQQQLQPTSPRVNLVFGGGIEEATVEYVNVGFQYDSQDADEEEVERRFRERKAYLFKRDEEDEVDGDQTGKWSSETYKQDEERSKKRHKVKENGRVGRDQGHDNAAYTDDSEVDSVHAEETEKTKHDEIDSESIPSDVSSSSDKPNKLNDADDKSPNKQNHTVSEIQSKASPGASSDNAYNSEMTVIEFLQMAQKGEEDQGDAENEGESYEADEMDQERSSAQIAPDRRDSGIEKMSEMTVRDFLSLVKEKRAMSDVTRVRAESLTTPYDIKKSARRRAQSAEDIWAKTSEPSQPDEKPTPENSGEMSATTPPSALEGDAEHKYEDPTTSSPRDHKESENTSIPLVEGAAGENGHR